MKITITEKISREIEIKYIRVVVPVRYEEEDISNDFPFRFNDVWDVTIDVDTHKIVKWPIGVSKKLCMKVCDEGKYYLLDANRNEIAKIDDDYVPRCFPNSYGDYIEFNIESDGTISNWKNNPDFSVFFKDEEE